MANDFSQYLIDPSLFDAPPGAGWTMSGGSSGLAGGVPVVGDIGKGIANVFKDIPLVGDILGGLFGGDDEKKWKPYVKNGQMVWKDPRGQNPVPLSSIPGAQNYPTKQYLTMANNVKAVTDLLPHLSKAVAGQIIPQAQAKLAAAKATSPGYNELMVDLFRKFGPQLSEIGNAISRQDALAKAATDRDVLAGPGKELVQQALETAKIYDPEYFKTREAASARLNELLGSINLGSGLSGSERAEIERAQAQEGGRRGTYNTPSNIDAVSNAMQFGQAGFNRLNQNRSALSSAIANATAALPSFKSGVDVFQVATGKPSAPNVGNDKFTGINNSFDDASSLASGLLGHTVSTEQNQAQIALQKELNKKDWADYMNQVTSSISDIGGIMGGAMTMCWIARRAFGNDNPKWLLFRHWLLTKAPEKLHSFYTKYGEKIADKMTDKQAERCREMMSTILQKEYSYVQ